MAKKKDRISIEEIILRTIAVAGVLALVMVAPNVVQVLEKLDPNKKRNQRRGYYVPTAITRLKNKGLVTFEQNKAGGKYLKITKAGAQKLLKYQLGDIKLKKPKKWDKKYRVVIFDVKEYRRGDRDDLRDWLIHFGFIRLQNSVWVYPYPCEELVTLLKTSFGLGKNVLYMVVDSIENDGWIRKEFKLL